MVSGINNLFPLHFMLKHTCLFIALLLVAMLPAQDSTPATPWPKETPAIDGLINDWPTPFNLYDGTTGILFALANDSNYLYLCVTGADEYKLSKMMRTGWQVAITGKEKNRKVSAEINFPKLHEDATRTDNADGQRTRNFKTLLALYRAQFSTVQAKGFITQNGIVNVTGTTGIKIQIGTDSVQGMVYEIAIPLAELMPAQFIQLNEQLVLTISVNGTEIKQNLGENNGWGSADTNIGQSTTGSMNRVDAMNGINQNPTDLSGPGNNNNQGPIRVSSDRATLKQKLKLSNGK